MRSNFDPGDQNKERTAVNLQRQVKYLSLGYILETKNVARRIVSKRPEEAV